MSGVRALSDVRAGVGKPVRLLFLAAVVAAVALMAVIGHCVPLPSASQQVHMMKLPLPTVGGKIAGAAHQRLLNDGKPMCKASKLLATVALPKSAATALPLLGVVLAGLVGKDWLTKLVMPAGRGPPGALVVALSGQDLLTRFCLARR